MSRFVRPIEERMDILRDFVAMMAECPSMLSAPVEIRETPKRFDEMRIEFFGVEEPELKIFRNDGYDEMVINTPIQFFSFCEHHILPFIGKAHVAYIPSKKGIVGISKLDKVVKYVSQNKLQLQERVTKEIADYLEPLKPKGIAVLTEAFHCCKSMRGARSDSITVFSVMRGAFATNYASRQEFLKSIEPYRGVL